MCPYDTLDPIGRRRLLGCLAAAAGSFVATGASATTAIEQPETADAAAFMKRAEAMKALALRAGDQGYGAVIVRDGVIVGQAPSRVVTNLDPTAHAETECIRDTARRLGTRDLSGCVMYSTSRPCRMCETAAYWAGIDRMVYGAGPTDGGRPQYSSC